MTHPNHIEVREQRWHAYRQDLDMAGDCAFAPLDPAPHRRNYTPPTAPLSKVQGWILFAACVAAIVSVCVIGLMQAFDLWVP